MKRTLVLFVLGLFAVSAIMTATLGSFSAEVTRQSNINVTSDTESVIKLTPSTQYNAVQIQQDGRIEVSPGNVGADSINRNMYLQIGNPANPTSDYAFTIDSLADSPVTLNITLQQQQSYTSTADSVSYTIVNSDGTQNKTLLADGTTKTFAVEPSDTLYIAIEIDTLGESTGNLNTNLIIQTNTQ